MSKVVRTASKIIKNYLEHFVEQSLRNGGCEIMDKNQCLFCLITNGLILLQPRST